MTFDPTKPVRTRDGRPVRIGFTDLKTDNFPIIAAIYDTLNDKESVHFFTKDGKNNPFSTISCDLDLVNIVEKPEPFFVGPELRAKITPIAGGHVICMASGLMALAHIPELIEWLQSVQAWREQQS